MKKRDLVLILSIILVAVLIWMMSFLFAMKENGRLVISVDNETYGIYDLIENQEISIGDTNICVIKDGFVSMSYGKCPDQVCVHSVAISKTGQTIICMPNRVVLEIIQTDESYIDTLVE